MRLRDVSFQNESHDVGDHLLLVVKTIHCSAVSSLHVSPAAKMAGIIVQVCLSDLPVVCI